VSLFWRSAGMLPRSCERGDFGVTRGLSFLPDGFRSREWPEISRPPCRTMGFAAGDAKCTYGNRRFFCSHGKSADPLQPSTADYFTASTGEANYALEGASLSPERRCKAARRLKVIESSAAVDRCDRADANQPVIFVPGLVGSALRTGSRGPGRSIWFDPRDVRGELAGPPWRGSLSSRGFKFSGRVATRATLESCGRWRLCLQ